MKTRSSKLMIGALALASWCVAQPGGRGPQGNGNGAGVPEGPDMAKLQTIDGTIESVQIGYNVKYPSIVVTGKAIKLAPVWYMVENDFELVKGQSVRVLAAASLKAGDPYLYGIEVTDNLSKTTIKLRDASGVPLWQQPGSGFGRGAGNGPGNGPGDRPGSGNGNGNGQGSCTQNCFDAASIKTATGIADAFEPEAGLKFPTLVLHTSDGKSLSIKIGPERLLLAADFEIEGTLTVRYGTSTCKDELVALSITNAAGKKIVLRNDDGSPAWNR